MHFIKIRVSPERIHTALTTADGIRNWWTRDADLDPYVGGTGEFRFHEGKSVIRVRIGELQPLFVRWKTLSAFRPEWEGTIIAFELRAEEGGTTLLFAHRGFAEYTEVYAQTTTGWGYYLISLQQHLETGNGVPAPNPDFARVIR